MATKKAVRNAKQGPQERKEDAQEGPIPAEASCTTCRKARRLHGDRGFELHFRDLDKES